MDQAPADPVERFSDVEVRVERARRTAGFVLAPIVFTALLAAPLGLDAPAHRLAAILAAVVVLWVCESLPLAITAILGPILAIMLQVAPARQVFASFADPVVFVFIGGFMLAEAMFVHRLDRRIAFVALASRFVGSSAGRALVVYGAVTTFLDKFNAGDIDAFFAAHRDGAVIVDEFPPFVWGGSGSAQRWASDYGTDAEAKGISGGRMDYGKPIQANSDGSTAYIVLPTTYRFQQNGVKMAAPGSMTFVMTHVTDAWKISSWTYSGATPAAE